jgi:lysophosphatidate acyltransferase
MLEALRDISEPRIRNRNPRRKRIRPRHLRLETYENKRRRLIYPLIDTAPVELSRESDTEAEPSTPSVSSSRRDGSENGVETEEDEGMVLVGRPDQK